MIKKVFNKQFIWILVAMVAFSSCDNEDDVTPEVTVLVSQQQIDNQIIKLINEGVPGSLVTAEGFGLEEMDQIIFDGKVSTIFNPVLNSENAIFFTVPYSDDAGSRFGDQKVSFVKKSGDIIDFDFKIIQPTPKVLRFTPEIPMPGETVIITGDWLHGATLVTLEDVSLPFTQIDGAKISVVIPEDTTEGGSMAVTTPAGVGALDIVVFNENGPQTFSVTDFDGGGIFPGPWESYGAADGSSGQKSGGPDGDFYELLWAGATSFPFIGCQSGGGGVVIPEESLEGKTIEDVFLLIDINCGDAPGTTFDFIIEDGTPPGAAEVNYQTSYVKADCNWETLEIPLNDFVVGYGGGDPTQKINILNIVRVKVGMNIRGGLNPSKAQIDNVKLLVK